MAQRLPVWPFAGESLLTLPLRALNVPAILTPFVICVPVTKGACLAQRLPVWPFAGESLLTLPLRALNVSGTAMSTRTFQKEPKNRCELSPDIPPVLNLYQL